MGNWKRKKRISRFKEKTFLSLAQHPVKDFEFLEKKNLTMARAMKNKKINP
jgi:hypothetical protein